MRIAIVGCRGPRAIKIGETIDHYRRICDDAYAFACALPEGTIIVSGGAEGVDQCARLAAKRYPGRLQIEEHLPDYEKYAPARAPLARNLIIVERSDEIHAWPAPWSRGTWHTINEGRKAGKPVTVHEVK